MDTEETKTEQEQAESPTFAQRIESITNEWKESILQDTRRFVVDSIMTEEDVENIVETVIDNSSDLDYKIEGRIDDYDFDWDFTLENPTYQELEQFTVKLYRLLYSPKA